MKFIKGINKRMLFISIICLPMLIFSGYVLGLALGNNLFKLIFNLPIILNGDANVMHFWGWIVTPIGLIIGLIFSYTTLFAIPFMGIFAIMKKNVYLINISILLFIVSVLIYFSPLDLRVMYATYQICPQCSPATKGLNWFAWLPFPK